MNTIGYFEIQSDNLQKAQVFYGQIFGWKFVREENFPIEYYRIEKAGIYGGLLPRPAAAPSMPSGTNAFVCSVEIKSFDETAQKILELGGKVALPKFAVPGRCWQGYFLDLDGNTFGIFQVDPKAA